MVEPLSSGQEPLEAQQQASTGASLADNEFGVESQLARPSLETARNAAREFITEMNSFPGVLEAADDDVAIMNAFGLTEEQGREIEELPEEEAARKLSEAFLAPVRTYDGELKRIESLLIEEPQPKELDSINQATMEAIIEIRSNLSEFCKATETIFALYLVANHPLASFNTDLNALNEKAAETIKDIRRYGNAANRLSVQFLNSTRSASSEN